MEFTSVNLHLIIRWICVQQQSFSLSGLLDFIGTTKPDFTVTDENAFKTIISPSVIKKRKFLILILPQQLSCHLHIPFLLSLNPHVVKAG